MKKIINIFLIITYMFSFYILYGKANVDYINEMRKIQYELPNSYKLMIPTKIDDSDKNEIYKKIVILLDKYHSGMIYERVGDDESTQIKYIYDINMEYQSKIIMKYGSKLTSMEESKFISTVKKNDENQIGIIASFDNNIKIDIKPLKCMVEDSYNFSGNCYILLNKGEDINKFIDDIENSIGIKGVQVLDTMNPNLTQTNKYQWIILILLASTSLLILYELLNSYNKIGIKKLCGYSDKDILFEEIILPIFKSFAIAIIIMILLSLIVFNQFNIYIWTFILKYLTFIFIETIILLSTCLVMFIYIKNVSIVKMLKNKKSINGIFALNYIFKILGLIALIYFMVNGINNIQKISSLYTSSYQNWDKLDGYGVIKSMKLDKEINISDSAYQEKQKNIYMDFNKTGAVYANFSEYLPSIRETREKETTYYYERDNVIVNPNYLKLYNVYDEYGNRIYINEEDEDFIILVPSKYKDNEKQILDYTDVWKSQLFNAKSKEQKTKIIWTKSNQNIFTCAIDINIKQNNNITDPIIHVITENNASVLDYNVVIGGNGNPFKIKAIDNENVKVTINDIFGKYNIKKIVGEVSYVNEQLLSEMKDLKDNVQYNIVFVVIILLIIITIIINNIYNYIDKYKQVLAVKKICGYSTIEKYKNFIVGLIIIWNIVYSLSIIVTKGVLFMVAIMSIVGFSVELIFSIIAIIIIEKRRVIKVLKGE
ncbi:MAG: DUF1430 domain-containing protein [Cetobacterium sp.]